MGNIEFLVDTARESGLTVDLRVNGVFFPLPPGADVSAYRIIQEALTNTLQHAGPGTRAIVSVDYGDREVSISVVDNGPGSRADFSAERGESIGQGIVGMRERVNLYGGDLVVGAGPDGGFEVRARIPTGG
jgi:signal transduction histidine kinase